MNEPESNAKTPGRKDATRQSFRRKGKIARLPFELRTKVNIMLRDGQTYPQVIKFLTDNGFPGVEQQNLTNWAQGGHQEWLAEQERTVAIKVRGEAQAAMLLELQGNKQHLEDANSLLLADTINDVLQDIDPADLKSLIAAEPKQFFMLAQSVNSAAGERSRRIKVELELTKYRDVVAEQKALIEKALASKTRKGGLSDEALRQIEEAAKLL